MVSLRAHLVLGFALMALMGAPSGSYAVTYRDLIMSYNPVAYWRLGETSGTIAADETGSNAATYYGPTLGQTGVLKTNKAVTLDGTNDYIDAGSFGVSGSALTLLAWVKPSVLPTSEMRLISKKKIWTVLLVVVNANSLTTEETNRRNLISGWGYKVNLISASDTQTNFNTAVANADVAYVSSTITATTLSTKLKAATIGVVVEPIDSLDDFGIAGNVQTKSRTDVRIVSNSHYITSGSVVGGTVTLTTSAQTFMLISSNPAPGLVELTETFNTGSGYKTSLSTLSTGASLNGGGTAAGRRVAMPWGDSTFQVGSLNSNGQLAMQRSIEWAAGRDASSADQNRHLWTLGIVKSGINAYAEVLVQTGGTTTRLASSTAPLTLNDWSLVAAVYNGSSLKVYVNGVQAATTNISGSLTTGSGVPIWLGNQPEASSGNSWARPVNGSLDEVAIINSALTATQILGIYDARLSTVRVVKWLEIQ